MSVAGEESPRDSQDHNNHPNPINDNRCFSGFRGMLEIPRKMCIPCFSQRSEKKMSGGSPKGRDEMRCSGGSDDSDPMGIIRLSLLR
jgi:hypothetical protein